MLDDFGGLTAKMPVFAVFLGIATFSSIGLPGLNGFIGEFLILLGAFKAGMYTFGILAATGVILGAIYMLSLYRRVFLGETRVEANLTMTDLDRREMSFFVPLIALMVILGLFSPWLTERIQPSVGLWLEHMRPWLEPIGQ